MVKNGTKTIESRLNDDKRQSFNVGDTLTFVSRDDGSEIKTTITDLYQYETFEELFSKHDSHKFGGTNPVELLENILQFYSKNEEQKWGVVGIEFNLDKSIGLERGTVELRHYSPEWADLFEQEKQLLVDTFGDRILAVEHIGSTAIPGIPAKPIIDMNAAVESLDDIDDFIQKLPELGYEYIPERRYTDRQFFPKGSSERRTHHLNLVELDSQTAWKNQLLFRDYLIEHEDVRNEYAELKRNLANKYADNREEYTEQKSDLIMNTIKKAASTKGQRP